MIEELTPEQEELKEEFKQKWLKNGWGAWETTPEMREKAKEALTEFYKIMKQPVPEFIFFRSPKEANIFIKECTGEGPILSSFDGHLDSYWICFYTFCREIGNEYEEEYNRLLDLWVQYVENAGSVYFYENACIVCDRPVIAEHDDNLQIHCDTGPALAYADGDEIYAIHNVLVDKKVVMEPWTITLEEIQETENIEVRRIMQDRWCWPDKNSEGLYRGSGGGRWLHETEAKLVDMDTVFSDSRVNVKTQEKEEVYEERALYEDQEQHKYLCVGDSSTDRVYYLRVPDEVMTCKEAFKALYGVDESKVVGSS